MKMYGMSDRAILRELGRRLQRRRLDLNLSQQQLADRAGINRTTVSQLERGVPATLLTLVQVLRALDALETLDGLLPDPGPSPLELARARGKQRRRATGSRKRSDDPEEGGAAEW